MDNKLYESFAGYYAVMSNHQRNFKGQLDCLLDLYEENTPCNSLLELFAGQAMHSIEAFKKENIREIAAIDGSADMKVLATSLGFTHPADYITGMLPEALSTFTGVKRFDCILCLFHGISNLPMMGASVLFRKLSRLLTPHGRVFLEVHNIRMMMEYLSRNELHYSEVSISAEEHIEYAWPGGKIEWSPYDYNAIVPIDLNIHKAGETETVTLISRERIYSSEQILFLAALHGFNARILSGDIPGIHHFGHSVMIELSLPGQHPH